MRETKKINPEVLNLALTNREVEERVAEGSVNKIPDPNKKGLLEIALPHALELPNVIVAVAVVFLVIYGQITDAVIISGVIGMNILIAIFQEYQARRSLQRINVLVRSKVNAMRDGKLKEIDPEEIVKDDILKLTVGENIYVDGKIIESTHMLVDESAITGESDYISKQAGDEIMSGSIIVSGDAFYKVENVGDASFINRVNEKTKSYLNHLSPLQININNIVKLLTAVTLISLVFLFTLNFLRQDLTQAELFKTVVAVVGSMIPQGIILTLTIAFMVGVFRMYKRGILVQKSNSVETLASIKVLCMDKTGTITANKLKVDRAHRFKNSLESKTSDSLVGIFIDETSSRNKTIESIESYLDGKDKQGKSENDDKLNNSYQILKEFPFTSRSKFSGLEILYMGKVYRVVLGGFDILTQAVKTEFHKDLVKLDESESAKGNRNLLFIVKEMEVEKGLENKAGASAISTSEQRNMVSDRQVDTWLKSGDYLPLQSFMLKDTLREGAREIMISFIDQNVKPVIISGDNPSTLVALLKQLNIDALDKPITGGELAAMNETNQTEAILGHDVFARVTPEQKLEIIKVYQKYYGRVAMVGDGVNDALAIKQANLGISLKSGANVTQNVADVVLLNDNLSALADVVQQGREILFNTLRSAQLLLIKNVYALILIIGTLVLAVNFPFGPRGLFLLAFTNTSIPVLALLIEKQTIKRNVQFMPDLLNFVLTGGIILGIMSLGLTMWANTVDMTRGQIEAFILSFLILTGVVTYMFVSNKTYKLSGVVRGIKKAIVPICMLIFYSIVLLIPPFRGFFELEVFPKQYLLIIIGCSILFALVFSFSLSITTKSSKLRRLFNKAFPAN